MALALIGGLGGWSAPCSAQVSTVADADPEVGVTVAPSPGSVPVPREEAEEVVSPEEAALRAQVRGLFPPDRHFLDLASVAVARAYAQRGFRPLWGEDVAREGFHRALAEELKRHALPELLALDPVPVVARAGVGPVPASDLALTVAFCDAALHIRVGAVAPARLWPDWDLGDTPGSDDRSPDAVVADLVTATALRPFDLSRAMEAMAPKNWIYRELLKAYPAARDAVLNYSGLPQIPNPEQVGPGRPGEFYPGAQAIAAHLIDRGYLTMAPAQAAQLSSMTAELTGALIAFQLDYGLEADGIFGPTSWRYLNVNAADRFRSIVLNLHRARLMPNKPGERYLLANLPCAELHLFEANDFLAKSMRIVHGKADPESQRTRIFRDCLQEVVFGPYWNVPPSIATKELIPRIQEDWGYLARNDYEIVGVSGGGQVELSAEALQGVAQGRLLLRQKPGATNALGYVKFLFPNSFNIYMHDTPWKEYFAHTKRDHSHGCIRLEKPDELAAWVFSPQGWTAEQARAAMANHLNRGMGVKGGINVYITYFTTFPRPSRTGRHLLAPGRDVYGHDATDARTLAAFLPWKE
jgi:murein L,D-transpeptidase YcbB/YkuD